MFVGVKLIADMAQLRTEAEVFGVSPDRYNAMSDDQRFELTRAAARIAMDLVDQTFDEIPAEWIIVGTVPPRVLLSGNYRDPHDDSVIDQLAEEHGVVPFFYSRPEHVSGLDD